jgi:hypothetical protein
MRREAQLWPWKMKILLAVVETDKWQYMIQDRRLALQRINHEVEGQAIRIQQPRDVLEGFFLRSVG